MMRSRMLKKKIASVNFFREIRFLPRGSTVLGLLNLTFYVPKTGRLARQKNVASPHPDFRYIMISWPAYI